MILKRLHDLMLQIMMLFFDDKVRGDSRPNAEGISSGVLQGWGGHAFGKRLMSGRFLRIFCGVRLLVNSEQASSCTDRREHSATGIDFLAIHEGF